MNDDVLQLEWSSYVGSDAICLMLRNANFPRRSVLHTHDFAEVFVVETGRAIHQTGPREHQVTAGDVVFIRPDDIHRFRSPTEDFVLFNVAFPASVLSDLRRRYAPHMPFPWDGDAIRAIRPSSLQSTRLRELAVDLGHQPSSHVRLDRYLIELLASAEGPIGGGDLMPPWLRESIERWKQDSNAMGYGVRGLAELAGRSREHVSRVIRQTTNMRAVDLVNRLRMETAAGMLRMTETAIPRIAAEVGLPNLSHFYEVFRAQYGTTPRAYRVGPRKAIDPPPIPGARPRSPATPAHRPRCTADQEHER